MVPELVAAFDDPPPAASRDMILYALASYDHPDVDPLLVQALADDDPHVRTTAADAAGRRRIFSAANRLLNALSDESETVSEHAAIALGKIATEQVVDTLMNMIDDPIDRTRQWAAFALGECGSLAVARIQAIYCRAAYGTANWSEPSYTPDRRRRLRCYWRCLKILMNPGIATGRCDRAE